MQIVDREGTAEEAKKLGLKDGEFDLIVGHLGRKPSFTELAMFSGMWSEHCSYKNSILLLKKLYSESDRLLAKPGEENAGSLKINDKQAVVFKVESHNHPSAVEPYQGAATGVGGIMRDVFTMGARPIATLNSLRFGHPSKDARTKYLLRRVVKGIGDYGNSLGIANTGGEIFFHESYTRNPLVNAMTVGVADIDKMATAKIPGPGKWVVYVGAKTGRDGIHGASFASKNLSKESEEERSAVQVGDPFLEKLVMEATIECIQKKLVLAIQDMGAAGLVSSSSEMAASGNVGVRLELEKVPARETGMVPFEFMLSESQERMLMVIEPGNWEKVKAVFDKWELDAAVIGETTEGKNLQIFMDGKCYADLTAEILTKKAPRYEREQKPVAMQQGAADLDQLQKLLEKSDVVGVTKLFAKLLAHPNLCSRQPIYRQYDTDIGLKRVIEEFGFKGVIAGIRRDEQATRAKERVFSPRADGGAWDFRDQPAEFWDHFNASLPDGAHMRIHPLLSWTELDIWRYVQRENIPLVPLYFSKNGKRYRSLGDQDITSPVVSDASSLDEIIAELRSTKTSERAGRAMDHEREDAFERLRDGIELAFFLALFKILF